MPRLSPPPRQRPAEAGRKTTRTAGSSRSTPRGRSSRRIRTTPTRPISAGSRQHGGGRVGRRDARLYRLRSGSEALPKRLRVLAEHGLVTRFGDVPVAARDLHFELPRAPAGITDVHSQAALLRAVARELRERL